MNFLDIIIIIVLILLTLGALILQFMAVSEEEYGMIGGVFVMWLVICGFIFCVSFVSIDKKKLKRKCFKNNSDYFKFCKNMTEQIYIVGTTSSKSGKIVVYYGAKLGRPPKNKNKLTQEEYNKRKIHYRNRYKK